MLCVDGRFKPILKLYGPNLMHNTVVLDKKAWQILLDHKDILMQYLRGDYNPRYNEFGSPTSINFFNFEVRSTTAHQEQAIGIAQLTAVIRPPTPTPLIEHDGQIPEQTPSEQSTPVTTPPLKKRRTKLDTVPMFTMHAVTCEGLFQLGECISHAFERLGALCALFDTALEFIVEYLKEKMNDEFAADIKRAGEGKEKVGRDSARNNMKNKIVCPLGFSLFYHLHKGDIKNLLDMQEQIGGAAFYDKNILEKFLIELSAFYQYMLRNRWQPLLNFLQ